MVEGLVNPFRNTQKRRDGDACRRSAAPAPITGEEVAEGSGRVVFS